MPTHEGTNQILVRLVWIVRFDATLEVPLGLADVLPPHHTGLDLVVPHQSPADGLPPRLTHIKPRWWMGGRGLPPQRDRIGDPLPRLLWLCCCSAPRGRHAR